ncbi:DnaJ family domain-containing protein [Isoptericola aurantiacus]|uniref:DnaJ family domain-containing protein n=1 Tax=Isoptericola aurantiacus TaxID=3377839 RepID=UPI00383B6B72
MDADHRERGPERDPARHAAQYRVDRETAHDLRERDAVGGDDDGPDAPQDEATPRRRMDDRALWVDTVVDQAIRRGEFDDLPLQGKPLPGIGGTHDPDWWLKSLVQRDHITGVLPAAQLRADAAAMDDTLDREHDERRVREILADFNARVIDARRQLTGGPPVVTPTRDVEDDVARWHRRRARP